jgi:hypothetical protein
LVIRVVEAEAGTSAQPARDTADIIAANAIDLRILFLPGKPRSGIRAALLVMLKRA